MPVLSSLALVVIICVGVVASILQWWSVQTVYEGRKAGKKTRYSEWIAHQTHAPTGHSPYTNRTVKLDGQFFKEWKFQNSTLRFGGTAPYHLEGCEFIECKFEADPEYIQRVAEYLFEHGSIDADAPVLWHTRNRH